MFAISYFLLLKTTPDPASPTTGARPDIFAVFRVLYGFMQRKKF
jgi:hypothetical protein